MDEKKVATTQDEMRAMIAEAASSLPESSLQYDDQDRALPPWLVFPDYGRSSMGWRMGNGEDYWIEFPKWFRALTPTQRSDYRDAYRAPDGWEDYYHLIESK
ncbi:MAG: hypothetical protein ABJK59_11440 [Erythrobacter sp.]|uniref:hypothetical protein n=1 Tax=Erythrobacter sp. TaxID=1042 RepID=UPI003298D0F7